MSFSEGVRPLLAARAPTDPNAAKLLEIFTKADEIVGEHWLERIGDVGKPKARASAVGIAVEKGRHL